MTKSNGQETFITAGKKPREELRLPTLHFIVSDDWIPKLGEKTFCSWLKLLTLVDRTDEAEDKYGNKFTVPRSLENVAKLFEMSKSTFYRNVIHPLWNFGLIDLVEWGESKKLGQNPINIIVYDYPQNSYELAVKPIEKCRDYKTQYNSNSAIFGRIGGQLRKEESQTKAELLHRFKNETVDEISVSLDYSDSDNRFKNETVDGFKNETESVSKTKPNNYSNTFINESNTNINESNTINSSSNRNNKNIEDPELKKEKNEEEENKNDSFEINSYGISVMKELLTENDLYDDRMIESIVNEMIKERVSYFTKKEILEQHRKMVLKVDQGEKIYDWAKYFVGGILKTRLSESTASRQQRVDEAKRKIAENKKKSEQQKLKRPDFNWLES